MPDFPAPAERRSRTAKAAAALRDRIAATDPRPFGEPIDLRDGPLRAKRAKDLDRVRPLVTVAPVGGDVQPQGRGTSIETVEIAVGVQTACGADDVDRLDVLLELVESIADVAETAGEGAGPLAGAVSVEFDPIYSGERLDAGIFESVVVAAFSRPRRRRAAP